MSYLSVDKKMVMWPALALGGAGFLASAGITIHTLVEAFGGATHVSFIESLIGVICLFIGFLSIIVLLALIGAAFERTRKDVIIAIVLLVLFIGFESFITFYPGIEYLGGIWGNLAILIVYGNFRGIALQKANKSLNSISPRYGSGALVVYGWNFVITTALAFILTLIGSFLYSFGMIVAGLWILIGQIIINAICLIILGIMFILNAINNPEIIGSVARPVSEQMVTRTRGTVGATNQLGTTIRTESAEYYQQDTRVNVTTSIASSEAVKTDNRCEICGSIIEKDSEFCSSCGAVRK